MKQGYVVAPQAARDLVDIWRYLVKESSEETADRVESAIRNKFAYLADFPNGGHWRRDLTTANVRFFSVYSYLIVYRPETKPIQIVAILHGHRDFSALLTKRS
jgi:plasmid stabilization system protein ParE